MAKRQLPVIPPDLVDEYLPSGVFSHSQYTTYKNCPRAYEFKYVLKETTPTSHVMFRGTSVHAGAEEAHKKIIETRQVPALEAMRAFVGDTFEKEKEEVSDWGEEKQGAVKDQALALYTRYHLSNLHLLRPVAAEAPFVVRVGTVPVLGYIDLVEKQTTFGHPKEDDPETVVDLKTSNAKWSEADVAKSTQMTLYSIVKGTPFVRIDNLVFTKSPTFHRFESSRNSHDKRVFIEDLEETADLVKRGIFPKTAIDSWACSERWCAFWSKCRGRRI